MTQAGPPSGSGRISEAITRVEAELGALWAEPDPTTGQAKVRASMMNFVVATAPAHVPAYEAAADDLTLSHPGRAFLVTLDGHIEPWDLRASVSAVCRNEGGAILCSDRIDLALGAAASRRAASVVHALSLAEVPTLVEIGTAAPPALVEGLVAIADRVIVDSATTSVSRIADVARRSAAPIADRAFVRTFSWREFVARFFDETPAMVRDVRRVAVTRTPGGAHDPAPLFLGWLASRLGWRFESPTAAVDAGGGAVAIELAADERADVEPGLLTGSRLWVDGPSGKAELSCARTAWPSVVRWAVESAAGGKSVVHEHPLGRRDESWVLVKAIDSREGDAIYRQAVLAADGYAKLSARGAS